MVGNYDVLEGWIPPTDESDGFAAIPEGPYACRVIDVEAKNTKSGGFAWQVSLEVADGGQYNGRKFFYWMNWIDGEGNVSGGIGFTQMALKALGIRHVGQTPGQVEPIQVSKGDLIGKVVIANIEIQQEGQYRGNNQVASLEPYGQPAAPNGAAPMPPVAAPGAPMQQINPAAPAAPAAPVAPQVPQGGPRLDF